MPKIIRFVLQVFAAAGLGWRRGVLKAQAEADFRKWDEPRAALLNVLSGSTLADMPTSRWIN